jgi:membrane protein
VDGLRRINFAAIGVVGVLFLIYTAVSMIVEVERAFNQIFRVPRGRSWVRRLTNYTTLLVYAPVCLALTFYLGQRLDTWIADLRESSTYVAPAALVEVVGRLAQVVVTTGLLLVLYTVVPNTRVRPLPALGGAVLAAVLFEALKFGFIEYLRMTGSAKYTRLYGSLALVPLFMLWVYITWAVVLFGLQFTHMLQYGRFRRAAQPLPEAGPMVVEPTAALLVMAGAARGFASGSPQTVAALAATSGLPEGVVGLVVQRLADRGLLHPVEHEVERSPEPWYALSRPPGSVRVAELLSIGFELAGGGEGNETVRRLRRAQIEAAGDETLADAAGLRADGSPQGVQAVAMAARGQGRPVAAGVPGPSPAAAADGNGRPAGGPGAGQGEARPATL